MDQRVAAMQAPVSLDDIMARAHRHEEQTPGICEIEAIGRAVTDIVGERGNVISLWDRMPPSSTFHIDVVVAAAKVIDEHPGTPPFLALYRAFLAVVRRRGMPVPRFLQE